MIAVPMPVAKPAMQSVSVISPNGKPTSTYWVSMPS